MAFTSARKLGYITHNPAEAVETLPEDSESPKQPFTLEQIKALLRHAEGDWKGVIMVTLYTGMRLKDVANLRWENVDLPNKWLSFKAGKTRQRIKIPMHDALHEFLPELPAPDSGKEFLFASLAGKSTSGKSGLSQMFKRLMERAKVRGEIVRERQGESGRSVSRERERKKKNYPKAARESHEGREYPKSPKFPNSLASPCVSCVFVSPVSEGQGSDKELEKELAGLARRNACTRAEDVPEKKRFKLARDVRAVEKRIGRDLTPAELRRTCDKWEAASTPFVGWDDEDHFAKFLAELTKVRVPTGRRRHV
jgi:Phage integrase family